MRFTIAAIIILCLSVITAAAQNNYTIKGLVTDTTTKTPMDKATVCVLNAKDSILQKFAYTNKGTFTINNLKPGKLLLLITYPGYADYVDNFTLDTTRTVQDMGSISMILQSRLLNEVIIKAKVAAIKIKGDTTEFNAAAYTTQKNAKVEDLLKQLQGMKIDQSGKITFQGASVDKILLDGEEFFSDDPTLITKNIRADMVDKVQVYDRKSDQAKRTGVDDGVKLKTINIQLTEDKRKGVFGKLEGDYGTDKYYSGQAMINKFSTTEKIAAYANIGNTGKVGLNEADNNKYGGGGYSNGNGNYGGVGLPLARDAGAHYNNGWNNGKQSFSTNYKIGDLNVDGSNNTITQNNLPGNYNTNTNNSTFHRYTLNQGFNAGYRTQLDSTSDLDASMFGSLYNGTSSNASDASTLRGNGVLLNSNNSSSTGSTDVKSAYFNIAYTKRFKKKGRSFSLSTNESTNQYHTSQYLKSNIGYYNDSGIQDSTHRIDQYKPNTNKSTSINTYISYTEPVAKNLSLSVVYGLSINNNTSAQLSYNKSAANRYDILDDTVSSNYKVRNLSNNYGFSLNYYTPKFNFRVGTNASTSNFKQKDLFADTVLTRRFVNWQPNAGFDYQLTKSAALNFNYSGSTNQPDIGQLQPLRQNSDPLNITIGNPLLKPEFTNSFNVNYRLYQVSFDRGINLNGSYSNTLNALVNNRVTDSAGVNTSQWVNLKNKQTTQWNLYAEVYSNLPKLGFVVNLWLSANGNSSYNYVNYQLNKSTSSTYSPRLNIWKYKPTYSFYFNAGPNYTISKSSLQQQINNNSYGFNSDFGFFTKLPLNFFMGSDVNYEYKAKNQVFDRNFSRTLLKSYIGKSFLKDESLKLSITGNDLLNQNTGYSRSGASGYFTENRYTTIRRNILFAVSWDFSKFGKSIPKQ